MERSCLHRSKHSTLCCLTVGSVHLNSPNERELLPNEMQDIGVGAGCYERQARHITSALTSVCRALAPSF